jgi:hypothetical protein
MVCFFFGFLASGLSPTAIPQGYSQRQGVFLSFPAMHPLDGTPTPGEPDEAAMSVHRDAQCGGQPSQHTHEQVQGGSADGEAAAYGDGGGDGETSVEGLFLASEDGFFWGRYQRALPLSFSPMEFVTALSLSLSLLNMF